MNHPLYAFRAREYDAEKQKEDVMKRRSVMLGLTLLCASAAAQGTTPTFTTTQATKGAAVYKAQCAMCHGAKLNNGGAPKLAGAEFIKKWNGNTVDDFHFITKSTMPQTNPGG